MTRGYVVMIYIPSQDCDCTSHCIATDILIINYNICHLSDVYHALLSHLPYTAQLSWRCWYSAASYISSFVDIKHIESSQEYHTIDWGLYKQEKMWNVSLRYTYLISDDENANVTPERNERIYLTRKSTDWYIWVELYWKTVYFMVTYP